MRFYCALIVLILHSTTAFADDTRLCALVNKVAPQGIIQTYDDGMIKRGTCIIINAAIAAIVAKDENLQQECYKAGLIMAAEYKKRFGEVNNPCP